MHYNPAEAIEAEQWLAIDEQERLGLIKRWISNQTGVDLDD